MRVIIVDDSRSSLRHLTSLVQQFDGVETEAFIDPEAALAKLSAQRFDLAIVDDVMPKIDGITFIAQMRQTDHHEGVPVIMVTASDNDAVKIQALEAGATDFLSKSLSPLELKIRLRNIIHLAAALRRLDDDVISQAREIAKATESLLVREQEMIFCLSKALEYRDTDTNDHTYRVATYSRLIAERMGLPEKQCRAIFLASPLHDIGKVAIPDGVLMKPGKLDEQEREIIKTHAAIGAHILSGSHSELIELAAQIAEGHHERWDGNGYPHLLAGEAIPLCARIVAIADVFDALTTERSYKRAMPFNEAIRVMKAERARHFDPDCLDAFLAALDDLSGSDCDFTVERLRERLDETYPSLKRAVAAI